MRHHSDYELCAIALGACLLLAAGCSSRPVVTDVSTVPPGGSVAGVPFRTRAPFTLRLLHKQADGTYKEELVERQELADENRLYAVSFLGQSFSNHKFELKTNPDGTLSHVGVSSESKAAEDLKGIQAGVAGAAGALTAVDKAKAAQEEERKKGETAAVTDLHAKQDALGAAQLAFDAAELANLKLSKLPSDTSDVDRAIARAAANEAMLKANTAFQRAGLAEPYPGVFPPPAK